VRTVIGIGCLALPGDRSACKSIVIIITVADSRSIRTGKGFLQSVVIVSVSVAQRKRTVIDSFLDFAVQVIIEVFGGSRPIIVGFDVAQLVVGKIKIFYRTILGLQMSFPAGL
jgi:hypothetical protein